MGMRLEFVLFAPAIFASAALASPAKTIDRPELFRRLIDCRAIVASAERLSCYDRQVGLIDEADRKKELIVVDRKEIRETRRSLFGFTLPRIGLFSGDKDDDKDEVKEISGTIEALRTTRNGWSLKLSDDLGTWEVTSGLSVDPRVGDKVIIDKAAFGSYLGQVGHDRGVRFQRLK